MLKLFKREEPSLMRRSLVRYLGDLFLALGVVGFVAGLGSILGVTVYDLRLLILLPVFAGPTYLFFILVGSRMGYIVNRRQRSVAIPWVLILPTICFAYWAADDLSSGIHKGESTLGYIWNTLIVGNHELALLSQWMVAAPVLTSLAFSFGAWLAIRRAPPA